MARVYHAADIAGSPKYLVDELISIMREEQSKRFLDISDPNITKRDAFFRQASKALRCSGVKEIKVVLHMKMACRWALMYLLIIQAVKQSRTGLLWKLVNS